MQILPITFQRPTNINHKANSRWIYDKYGNELYKTTTYFFRDDLDWESLVRFLCQKYKNVSHVNFINHACSCGMEPFSFVISLMLYAPENIKKFTPILAKDINPENILMAKKGYCGASTDDFMRIHGITKGRYKDFFNMKKDNKTDGLFTMYPKKVLTDKVVFEEGDIFKDIENIPEDNTFLSCRNFWAYLPYEKKDELARRLSERLKPSSTLLVGHHDTTCGGVDKILIKNGFEKCKIENDFNPLYQKV